MRKKIKYNRKLRYLVMELVKAADLASILADELEDAMFPPRKKKRKKKTLKRKTARDKIFLIPEKKTGSTDPH